MRRTIDITLTNGRDQGKVFRITEMPASQAEEWALKAIMALTKAGVDLPAGTTGMAGIASAGFQALGVLNFSEVKPLLDEMFSCVQALPSKDTSIVRPLVESDTEEVESRLRLRAEVFTLHTGFSIAGAKSKDSTSATPQKPSRSVRRGMSRQQRRRSSAPS